MKKLLVAVFSTPLLFASISGFAADPQHPVIDFSFAGYQAGQPIPSVAAVISVRPSGQDDTFLLQSAIDHMATLPLDAHGFRGAILLRPGRFLVSGQLHLNVSGVVLRGSGAGPSGTTIVAEGHDRRTLIEAGGGSNPELANAVQISNETVAAGARLLTLESIAGLAVGDHVVVTRPSTQEWISAIGMSGLPGTFANQRLDWKPGSHNLVWDRTITSINAAANQIEIDAPITTSMQKKYGGGTVIKIENNAALENIGIEDLLLESAYDKNFPKDEEHSWIAIALNHVQDAWVRRVTARHFVSSAVRADQRARRITIEDCRSEAPISETGGYRRQSFIVYGQQVLVYHCHSEAGMNDFATGLLAAGPNVFLDCDATGSLGASGAFEGWASGVLYERVHVPDSHIQLLLDQERAQGAGWTAANSLIWNSTAQTVDVLGPPGEPNYKVESPQTSLRNPTSRTRPASITIRTRRSPRRTPHRLPRRSRAHPHRPAAASLLDRQRPLRRRRQSSLGRIAERSLVARRHLTRDRAAIHRLQHLALHARPGRPRPHRRSRRVRQSPQAARYRLLHLYPRPLVRASPRRPQHLPSARW